MKTNFTCPKVLRSLLLNGGDISWMPDALLNQVTGEGLAPVLETRSGTLSLLDSNGRVELTWFRPEFGAPAEFTLHRDEAALLVGTLSAHPEQDLSTWRRLTGMRRSTFRCLGQMRPIPTLPAPWLGILLMPAALQLFDAHREALCVTARTVGRVLCQAHFGASTPRGTRPNASIGPVLERNQTTSVRRIHCAGQSVPDHLLALSSPQN